MWPTGQDLFEHKDKIQYNHPHISCLNITKQDYSGQNWNHYNWNYLFLTLLYNEHKI